MIDDRGLSTKIEIDGRISPQDIEKYGNGIVDLFVCGTTCMSQLKILLIHLINFLKYVTIYLGNMDFKEKYIESTHNVLDEITRALECVDIVALEKLANDIFKAEKVFFVGVGRVEMSLEAIAKRMSHLGIDAHCVGDVVSLQ